MMVLENEDDQRLYERNVAQQAGVCITMSLGKTQYFGLGYSSLPMFNQFNGFIIIIIVLVVHLDSR